MRKFIVLFFLLAALISAQATTVVQGNAFTYRGQVVEFHEYLDLFTFESAALARTIVAEDGSFKFTLNLRKKGLYLLTIGDVNAHLFVLPDETYTLVIPEPLPDDQISPAKDVFVHPDIFEGESKLNYQITELEKTINRFFIENTGELLGKGIRSRSDSLLQSLEEEFGGIESEMFQNYFHFKKAEFELMTAHGFKNVYEKYFVGKEIHYSQLSYANSFKLIFDEYFNYTAPKREERFNDELTEAMKTGSYSKLYHAFDSDPLLTQKPIRELLIISQLYEVGKERKYDLDLIINLLDSAIMTADQNDAKLIAANAQSQLMFLSTGSIAANFEFSDIIGNTYRLHEYKGRYIYLQIISDFTPETLRQMSLMKVLKEGYGAEIAMFSISLTESLGSLKDISKKYDFDWMVGKAMNPEKLKRTYDLRAFPSYFFLDEEMRIVSSPAPPPGAQIEKQFAKVWNSNHPNKQLRFRLQPPEESSEVPPQELPE